MVYPLRGRWQDVSRKESNISIFELLTGGDSEMGLEIETYINSQCKIIRLPIIK